MASNVKNSNLIVGLDIGTSKVVCIVGKYNETNDLEIVALGSYPSSGLKRGIVVNIDATTDAIKKAVDQAQSMIEEKIKNVFYAFEDPDIRTFKKAKKILKFNKINTKLIRSKKFRNFYKSYFHNKKTYKSFVTGKIAVSKDFKTINKKDKWITNYYSRKIVHLLRNKQ